jgi:hypothetical protein
MKLQLKLFEKIGLIIALLGLMGIILLPFTSSIQTEWFAFFAALSLFSLGFFTE